MFCGHRKGDQTRLICFFLMLAGVITEQAKPSKPNVNVTQKGQQLQFHSSTPTSWPKQCWNYNFTYSKCNEQNKTVTTNNNPTLDVEYDIACRYTVRAQVIYSSNCGGDKDVASDMSEPVYYGEDGDPNLAFKVAMIITPLILCFCLGAAIVLFRRHKDIIVPKVPDPSKFFENMLSTSDGLSTSLGGVKLYVPVMEDVASAISLEPKLLILPPNHDTCIPHMGNDGDGNDQLCNEKDTDTKSRHLATFH